MLRLCSTHYFCMFCVLLFACLCLLYVAFALTFGNSTHAHSEHVRFLSFQQCRVSCCQAVLCHVVFYAVLRGLQKGSNGKQRFGFCFARCFVLCCVILCCFGMCCVVLVRVLSLLTRSFAGFAALQTKGRPSFRRLDVSFCVQDQGTFHH